MSTRQRLLVALWPAFLMAGVLEVLVFAVLDPADMRWFGGELIGWSAQAVYTVSFLIFWAVMAVATGLTALLLADAGEVNAFQPPAGAPGKTQADPASH